MDAKSKGSGARRGFTLIEMLAVIVIIGILATMISAAAFAALRRAKVTAIAVEISQLDLGLNAYKERLGEYPPDFTVAEDVPRHIAKAFPDYTGAMVPSGDASTAILYWLGGPDGNGFSANPLDPFDNNPSRIGPFFEFDPGRIRDSRYYPPGVPFGSSSGGFAPYVYFRANRGGGYDGHTGWQNARPCRDTRSGGWANPYSFQIRSSGMDGRFGSGRDFPTGEDYGQDKSTYDDITNFSGKGTLEDAQ